MSIHKLEFLDQFGSDKHKASIPAKVEHMVKSIPPDADVYKHNTDSLITSKLVTGDHLSHLLHHPNKSISDHAAGNPNIKGEHLDHMVKHGSDGQISSIIHMKNPHLTPEHVHTILDRPVDFRGYHPAAVIAYKIPHKLDDHAWGKVADHPDRNMTRNAVNSRDMPMKHLLTVATEHPDDHTRMMAREQHFERHAMEAKVKREAHLP